MPETNYVTTQLINAQAFSKRSSNDDLKDTNIKIAQIKKPRVVLNKHLTAKQKVVIKRAEIEWTSNKITESRLDLKPKSSTVAPSHRYLTSHRSKKDSIARSTNRSHRKSSQNHFIVSKIEAP